MDISITYTKPALRINGVEYEVLMSDAEIMERITAMTEQLKGMTDLMEARALKRDAMLSLLDDILGSKCREHIAKTIAGLPDGRKLNDTAAEALAETLVQKAAAAYVDAFNVKYGEDA